MLHGVQTGAFEPATMLTAHEDGAVVAALLRTADRPVLVSAVPPRCSGAVVDALAALDPQVEGVQGPAEEAEAVAAALSARIGAGATVALRMRLFALDELRAPAGVAGAARPVGPDDAAGLDVLAAWRTAFGDAVGRTGRHPHTERDDVVRAVATGGGELLWEVDGEPVAQASARAVVAGMSRIGPVYTPPEHRNHGYAAAVTAAAARWALDQGARHVLLYTDLANPTTNRLYPAWASARATTRSSCASSRVTRRLTFAPSVSPPGAAGWRGIAVDAAGLAGSPCGVGGAQRRVGIRAPGPPPGRPSTGRRPAAPPGSG